MSSISVQLPTFVTKAPRGAAPLAEMAVSVARALAGAGRIMVGSIVRSRQMVARDELLDLAARYEFSQPGMASDLRAAARRSVDPS